MLGADLAGVADGLCRLVAELADARREPGGEEQQPEGTDAEGEDGEAERLLDDLVLQGENGVGGLLHHHRTDHLAPVHQRGDGRHHLHLPVGDTVAGDAALAGEPLFDPGNIQGGRHGDRGGELIGKGGGERPVERSQDPVDRIADRAGQRFGLRVLLFFCRSERPEAGSHPLVGVDDQYPRLGPVQGAEDGLDTLGRGEQPADLPRRFRVGGADHGGDQPPLLLIHIGNGEGEAVADQLARYAQFDDISAFRLAPHPLNTGLPDDRQGLVDVFGHEKTVNPARLGGRDEIAAHHPVLALEGDLQMVGTADLQRLLLPIDEMVVGHQEDGIEILALDPQHMAEMQGIIAILVLRSEQVLGGELFRLVELGQPVVALAVETDGVGKVEDIEVAVLVEGMKQLLVEQTRPPCQRRGHGPGGEEQGLLAALHQIPGDDLAEAETDKGNAQQQEGDQGQLEAQGDSHDRCRFRPASGSPCRTRCGWR